MNKTDKLIKDIFKTVYEWGYSSVKVTDDSPYYRKLVADLIQAEEEDKKKMSEEKLIDTFRD